MQNLTYFHTWKSHKNPNWMTYLQKVYRVKKNKSRSNEYINKHVNKIEIEIK